MSNHCTVMAENALSFAKNGIVKFVSVTLEARRSF
jgi:hypothetical protein